MLGSGCENVCHDKNTEKEEFSRKRRGHKTKECHTSNFHLGN